MSISVCVLGSSAALPSKNRHLSSHLLEAESYSILFDCGEATQFQLQAFGKKLNRIKAIFISHLHADHFMGLPSLIASMNLNDRNLPLKIFAPVGLEKFMSDFFMLTSIKLNFDLIFTTIYCEDKVLIHSDNDCDVFAFPLLHSVETYGFLFQQRQKALTIKKEFAESHQIEFEWFNRIKNGEDYVDSMGNRYNNSDITEGPKVPLSYAYCSDTAYHPAIVPWIKGVHLLYHESTFLESNALDAENKLHSTASQAAKIASQANANQLLLGHFSARYNDVSGFITEAQQFFPNVIITEEGKNIPIN